MVNEEKYFEELQKVIGETKSDNGINARWNEVLQRLDQLSTEYAKEIQAETGVKYEKDKELHTAWDFPPYRLLAMNLILSHWIGWHSVPENLHLVSDWSRIEVAYDKGRIAYIEYTEAKNA
ncbi:MAG TPA: hypothetical protein VE130_14990 [Nitrososphaeraceae archaeon]|nr:hypothetical protein [Nitrososphaeraceae archaeon]